MICSSVYDLGKNIVTRLDIHVTKFVRHPRIRYILVCMPFLFLFLCKIGDGLRGYRIPKWGEAFASLKMGTGK